MKNSYFGKKQGRHLWLLIISQDGYQRAVARLTSSLNQIEASFNIDADELTVIGPNGKVDIISEWDTTNVSYRVTVWADPEMQSISETIVVEAFVKEGGEPSQQSTRWTSWK